MIASLIDQKTLENWREKYWRLFSIHEIDNDVAVRLFGAAILLGFVVTFKNWENSYTTTLLAAQNGDALCWPFFQGCYNWFFTSARPYGYSQNIIYMALLGVIFAAAYGLLAKKYTLAHACMVILLLWKLYVTSINYRFNANFDYYHTTFNHYLPFHPA